MSINCGSNCLYFVKNDEVDCLIYFTLSLALLVSIFHTGFFLPTNVSSLIKLVRILSVVIWILNFHLGLSNRAV